MTEQRETSSGGATLSAAWLFDTGVPFEARLLALVDWLEAKRPRPVPRETQHLLAHLLSTEAFAVPFHLVFPDEPALDLTLENPNVIPPENPIVDDRQVENFIWRHTPLDRQVIAQLSDADLKYEALLGLVDWDAAFESKAAFEAASERYEVVTTQGADGQVVHEQDVFWYVAARDYGVSEVDARLFSRFKLIYFMANGVASDDVGTTMLSD